MCLVSPDELAHVTFLCLLLIECSLCLATEPGLAPGTGCPEPGGWTTRELKAMLRGLHQLNIVGADVVEVAPPYDDSGESTAWAAADLAYELLGLMVGHTPYPVEGYVARKKFAPKWYEGSGRKDEL